MQELFIAIILISFLALFFMLSVPMKVEDGDYSEKANGNSNK